MKKILIILFLGYACSDKLDLTYLPPPGSQYAGGRPEEIQTPFEFPKQTYSTTRRPTDIDFGQGKVNPEDYEATIGINRIPPRPKGGQEIPGTKVPFSKKQNTYGVPTTTVSYAFTQTTTHPPGEGFETTISPITGLPVFGDFNIPSQKPGQVYQDNINHQSHPSTPDNIQNVNHFESHRQITQQSQPGISGYQQTIDQYGNKQPTFSTTPGAPAKYPGQQFSSQNSDDLIYQSQPGRPEFQQDFYQQNSGAIPSFVPETSFGSPNQYPGNKTRLLSSTIFPQNTVSSSLPAIINEDNIIDNQGFSTTRPETSPADFENLQSTVFGPSTSVIPNQDQYQRVNSQTPRERDDQNRFVTTGVQPKQQLNLNQYPGDGRITQQKYPGDYSDVQGFPQKELSKPYQPFSTVNPSTGSPFDEYNTDSPNPGYAEPNTKGNIATTVYRPERPQAESDRNAVILNYESVINPEGFAYTFDTSNGIHADESGTAIDGVKAKGSFSYIGDDGKVYSIVYTADENGYQPHGDHLPTPPPIPEAIQRVIEKVQEEKEAGIIDDGTYDESKYGYKKYQDNIERYPQDSDVIADYGADLHTGMEFTIPSRNQFGSVRPMSGGLATNYNKEGQTLSQSRSGIPINRISDKKIAKTGVETIGKETQNKIPSGRPFVEIEKNTFKQGTLQDDTEDGSRKTSVQGFPGQNNERQNAGFEDTGLKDDIERKGAIKGTLRRPVSQEDDNSDGILNNHDINRERKPFITDMDKYEEVYTGRPVNKFSSRHPSDKTFVGGDGFVTKNDYDRNGLPALKITSTQPSRINNVGFTSEEYGTTSQTPLKSRVVQPPKNIVTVDQTLSKTRRPNRPGLRVNENYDNTDDSYDVNNGNKNVDTFSTPPDYETYEEGNTSSKTPQIFSTKYAATQHSSPHPDIFDDEQIYTDEKNGIVKNQYDQRVGAQPKFNPRTGTVENIEQKINQSGYQYIPPYNAFDEVNKLPSKASITRRPTQQTTYYGNRGSTSKPFVTPDDSHVTNKKLKEGYFEDGDVILNISGRPNKVQYQEKPNRVVSVTNNEGRPTPGQGSDYEIVTSTRPSSKPISSTYSPDYQTTTRPQNNDRYGQSIINENHIKATLNPSLHGDSLYYDEKESSTRKPYNHVSSTAPSLPQRPIQYQTTQKDSTTPGQQNVYYTEGSRRPGFNYGSLTTPAPSQGLYDGHASEGTKLDQYSTTYKTIQPVNPTNDYRAEITASRLPIAGLTRGPDAVVDNIKYSNRLPSTTYRPNYTIVNKEEIPISRPGLVVDRYGRPIATSKPQDYNQQYPESEGNVSFDNKNTRPTFGPPKGLNTPTGYQTSTEGIIGEDFSGPKQQQKFDAKTGYYY